MDPDRANPSGLTNLDVALSSVTGVNGIQVATLADGRHRVPVNMRLQPEERRHVEDLSDFYVYSTQDARRVPLRSVASPGARLYSPGPIHYIRPRPASDGSPGGSHEPDRERGSPHL